MITLNGTYCTISEIAETMDLSRQRVHILANKNGIKGVKVAKNFMLYSPEDVEKLLAIDRCKKNQYTMKSTG